MRRPLRGRIMIASGQQEINLTNRPPTALFRKRGLLPCRKRGGGGTLDSLEVGVTMLTPAYHDGMMHYLGEDLSRPRVEFLFSYLAGVHHRARKGALATIQGWDRDD